MTFSWRYLCSLITKRAVPQVNLGCFACQPGEFGLVHPNVMESFPCALLDLSTGLLRPPPIPRRTPDNSRFALRLLPILLCFLQVGCCGRERDCLPPELVQTQQLVEIRTNQPPQQSIDPDLIDSLVRKLKQQPFTEPPASQKLQILALSGGGINGAFTAGVLKGWTARGNRPRFDIVTGISTGGIISTFAFLGPQYDDLIGTLYTNITKEQVYQVRGPLALFTSDAQASSRPLQMLIDSYITPAVLQQVAQAHREGRRLYIGTTDLDTRRLVIWDMGAIAASNRPEALTLYRQIVLASSSIPGYFPPVEIGVTVNGRHFTELHADGGTTTQVFVRGTTLNQDPEKIRRGESPLRGSDIYILVSGKLYAPGDCVPRRGVDIGKAALESLAFAQGRNDLLRIFILTLLLDMNYHLMAIPQEFQTSGDLLTFDPQELRRLYQLGYQQGYCGKGWRNRPPGYYAQEQTYPRGGVHFQVLQGQPVIR